MKIEKAQFTGSFVREDACPKDIRPEYAFIGRSNVGKSSLINMLCQQKALAKVSNTPGKTQTINYFDINDDWYMVDLPGYGYARISQKKRAEWEKMIWYYLTHREQLMCVFVLIDAMIPPQAIDIAFMNNLAERGIPFVMVYTKTDRLKAPELKKNLTKIREAMLEYWEALPPEFVTSSERKMGREEILSFIEQTNIQFRKDLKNSR